MKKVDFQKMEGAGNDFVVIDNRSYNFTLDEIINFTPKLCDRKFGIGADGLLVLQKPEMENVDYTMIYRNADGSDSGMCGNGGRCLAFFASKHGFSKTHSFNVHENVYKAEISDHEISIQFPVKVNPSKLKVADTDFICADAATNHLVQFVSEEVLKDEERLRINGKKIRMHPELNPPGTNVNFVSQLDKRKVKVQTFERGVENLTLACGTGALASAIASHNSNGEKNAHSEYEVQMKGGTLKAAFDYDPNTNTYHHLILTGPANFVFKGIISL